MRCRQISWLGCRQVGRSIRRQRSGRFRRRAQVRITLAWRRSDFTNSTIRRLSISTTTIPIGSTRRANRKEVALSTRPVWNFRAVCIGSTRDGSILDTETTGGVNRLVGWRWRRRNGGTGRWRSLNIRRLISWRIRGRNGGVGRWRSLNIRRLISWRIRGSWVWITPLVLSTIIAFVLALVTLAIFLIPIAVSSWVTLERGLVEAAQGKAAANDGRRVIGSSSNQG